MIAKNNKYSINDLIQHIIIVILIVYFTVYISVLFQSQNSSFSQSPQFVVLKILSGFAIFASSGLFFIKKYNLNLKEILISEKQSKNKILILTIISISIGILAHLLRSFLSDLIHYRGINYGWRDAAFKTKDIYEFMILIWIIHATGEEIYFRGFLYNCLKKYYPDTHSIIISSFIFSIVHIPYSITHGLFLFMTSIIITLTYKKFGSLLYPICVHAITNIYSHYVTTHNSVIYLWLKHFFY